MKVYGHRGAAGLVAENTLESIAAALKYHVDGVEIDVHCCKSGELVVIHDETLERTTNGSGNVADYTLRELQQFTTEEGFVIPTLEQVLDFIDARCALNVELKGKNTAIPAITMLEEYVRTTNWTYDHFIISSFDHAQLHQINVKTNTFKLGVLIEENIHLAIEEAKKLNAFSVHPPFYVLTLPEVELLKKEGFQVYVWTVNMESVIERMKQWSVEGIITDYPNIIK